MFLFKIRPIKHVYSWYFSRGALPYWTVLLLDCLIVLFSSYIGYFFDLKPDVFASNIISITFSNVLCVMLFCVAFKIFHTYSGILRYSTVSDIASVVGASLLGTILALLFGFCMNRFNLAFMHLTSSLRHPKIFVKEFGDFLMSCHQHCLGVNLFVQR